MGIIVMFTMIIIIIPSLYEVTLCNMKGVTHSDRLTEIYHLTLQLLLALQRFLVSFIVLVFPVHSRWLFSAKKKFG